MDLCGIVSRAGDRELGQAGWTNGTLVDTDGIYCCSPTAVDVAIREDLH